MEVLTLCYRPDGIEAPEQFDRSDDQFNSLAIEQGYRLLRDWNVVPGTRDDGAVDEEALRAWCTEVRRSATASARLYVCDEIIGEVFAGSPPEDDGSWPCVAVRRIAEDIATDGLLSGMVVRLRAQRGAVWRGDGGDQERQLAAEFRQKADRIRFDSPFVAKTLDIVVQYYEKEADDWDQRAQWEKR